MSKMSMLLVVIRLSFGQACTNQSTCAQKKEDTAYIENMACYHHTEHGQKRKKELKVLVAELSAKHSYFELEDTADIYEYFYSST